MATGRAVLTGNLYMSLRRHVDARGLGEVFLSPFPVILDLARDPGTIWPPA
jgi:hypothetical protein